MERLYTICIYGTHFSHCHEQWHVTVCDEQWQIKVCKIITKRENECEVEN